MQTIEPFKLTPAYKDYLWGGSRLKQIYRKDTPLRRVAESWELSAHADGQSVIATGAFAGMAFGDFTRERPEACGLAAGEEFPILIKLIDAAEPLSIQVHPDDAYARQAENDNGKTEMWVILDAAPDAFLYHGFKKPIGRAELRRRLGDGDLRDTLLRRPVRKGDVFFIPAGAVHAIGKGILLAEVQQTSNATYRVDDYGRVDANGKRRPLHLDKAYDVINPVPADTAIPGALPPIRFEGGSLERLARCPYFGVTRVDVGGAFALEAGDGFAAVLVTEGAAAVETGVSALNLRAGDCAFIPAGQTDVTLRGTARALVITK